MFSTDPKFSFLFISGHSSIDEHRTQNPWLIKMFSQRGPSLTESIEPRKHWCVFRIHQHPSLKTLATMISECLLISNAPDMILAPSLALPPAECEKMQVFTLTSTAKHWL